MINVIGKENCGACMMAKKVLTKKGVEFEYVYLNDLSEEERELKQRMLYETMRNVANTAIENCNFQKRLK